MTYADTGLFVYEWLIPLTIANDLMYLAKQRVSTAAHFMNPENLHCTANVSPDPPKPNNRYADLFLSDINDSLKMCTCIGAPRAALSLFH